MRQEELASSTEELRCGRILRDFAEKASLAVGQSACNINHALMHFSSRGPQLRIFVPATLHHHDKFLWKVSRNEIKDRRLVI